jgi:hypothetical protein
MVVADSLYWQYSHMSVALGLLIYAPMALAKPFAYCPHVWPLGGAESWVRGALILH